MFRTADDAGARIEATRITAGQVGLLFLALSIPSTLACIPGLGLVAREAQQDGWLSILLATSVAGPFLLAAWILARRHPGQPWTQILTLELGCWIGGALGIFTLGIYLVHSAYLVRAFSEAVQISLLPRTPLGLIAATQLILGVYAARSGTEVMVRLAGLAVPLLLGSLAILLLAAWSDYRFDRFPPLFTTDGVQIVRGAVPPFGWLLKGSILLTIAFPYVSDPPSSTGRLLTIHLAVAGLVLVMILIATQAVLGVHESAHSLVLMVKLAREVQPVEFLARTEAVYLVFWHGATSLEIAAFHHGASLTLSRLLGLRSHRPNLAPTALLILVLTFYLFHDTADVVSFSQQVLPAYTILLEGVLPAVLLAASLRARRERPGSAPA